MVFVHVSEFKSVHKVVAPDRLLCLNYGTASQSSHENMASEKGPYLIFLGPPGAGKGTLVSRRLV